MPNLSDSTIWSLRQEASRSGSCDLSLACSAALWGMTPQARTGAKRRIARMLAAQVAL
jgi:hypothetical protein